MPIINTLEFCKEHQKETNLHTIHGANHRMKGSGELDEAIKFSKEILLNL